MSSETPTANTATAAVDPLTPESWRGCCCGLIPCPAPHSPGQGGPHPPQLPWETPQLDTGCWGHGAPGPGGVYRAGSQQHDDCPGELGGDRRSQGDLAGHPGQSWCSTLKGSAGLGMGQELPTRTSGLQQLQRGRTAACGGPESRGPGKFREGLSSLGTQPTSVTPLQCLRA